MVGVSFNLYFGVWFSSCVSLESLKKIKIDQRELVLIKSDRWKRHINLFRECTREECDVSQFSDDTRKKE